MSSPLLKSEQNFDKEFIDAGASAAVFKITLKKDQSVYALKQINLGTFFENERQAALSDAQKEYQVLRKGIPNVLRSFGSHYDDKNLLFKFSTELMEQNLMKFIQSNGPLNFENFTPIFKDILLGRFFFSIFSI